MAGVIRKVERNEPTLSSPSDDSLILAEPSGSIAIDSDNALHNRAIVPSRGSVVVPVSISEMVWTLIPMR